MKNISIESYEAFAQAEVSVVRPKQSAKELSKATLKQLMRYPRFGTGFTPEGRAAIASKELAARYEKARKGFAAGEIKTRVAYVRLRDGLDAIKDNFEIAEEVPNCHGQITVLTESVRIFTLGEANPEQLLGVVEGYADPADAAKAAGFAQRICAGKEKALEARFFGQIAKLAASAAASREALLEAQRVEEEVIVKTNGQPPVEVEAQTEQVEAAVKANGKPKAKAPAKAARGKAPRKPPASKGGKADALLPVA